MPDVTLDKLLNCIEITTHRFLQTTMGASARGAGFDPVSRAPSVAGQMQYSQPARTAEEAEQTQHLVAGGGHTVSPRPGIEANGQDVVPQADPMGEYIQQARQVVAQQRPPQQQILDTQGKPHAQPRHSPDSVPWM